MLDRLPALLGADDDPAGFVPTHPVLRDTWRARPGWRVPRSGRVLEALVPAVLEQKVTGREAWQRLALAGPALRRAGTGPGRAGPGRPAGGAGRRDLGPGAVLGLAPGRRRPVAVPGRGDRRRPGRPAGGAGRPRSTAEATAALRTLPGIGVWTAAEVGQRALGDADAVSVGDFHLAGLVGWALVGEKVDDDAMLELLEPYRGHRYRAVRMIELSGLHPPRRGPRYAGRDYRAM